MSSNRKPPGNSSNHRRPNSQKTVKADLLRKGDSSPGAIRAVIEDYNKYWRGGTIEVLPILWTEKRQN